MFFITLETVLLKHKVSQDYSPAGENAGSLTPFEMTYSKNDSVMEKPKLYHYEPSPSSAPVQSNWPGGNLRPGKATLLIVPLTLQLVWLFALALPIASIAWTITHEEIFRGPREYCIRQSEAHPNPACRKFFFIFTCEFCFSHYVTAFFLLITRYHLLFDDWRGYLIALFALVWIANQYMSVYAHLRLDIRKDRVEIKHVEKQVEKVEKQVEKMEDREAA